MTVFSVSSYIANTNDMLLLLLYREKFLEVMEDEEELSDAVQYLHHQGTLLHFTDQALKNVYFLDPQWLCDMMSSVIRMPRVGEESLVNNGTWRVFLILCCILHILASMTCAAHNVTFNRKSS